MADRIQLYEQNKSNGQQRQINLITDIGSVYKPNNSVSLGSKSAQIYSGANTQESLLSILGKINDWFSDISVLRNKTIYNSGSVRDTDLALQKNVNSTDESLLSQIESLANDINGKIKSLENSDYRTGIHLSQIDSDLSNGLNLRLKATYVEANEIIRMVFKKRGYSASNSIRPMYPVIINTMVYGIYTFETNMTHDIYFIKLVKNNLSSDVTDHTLEENFVNGWGRTHMSLEDASFVFSLPYSSVIFHVEEDCVIKKEKKTQGGLLIQPNDTAERVITSHLCETDTSDSYNEERNKTFVDVEIINTNTGNVIGKLTLSLKRYNVGNVVYSNNSNWGNYVAITVASTSDSDRDYKYIVLKNRGVNSNTAIRVTTYVID